jgi:two-component system sensor histidine kinase RegB
MMDRPLLALTSRPTGGRSPDITATENMRQLIQLRWIAVVGQLATILAVAFGLGIALPVGIMLAVVGMLAVANLGATLALHRHRVTDTEIALALLLDMAALTVQLYLSGGATNPFISLYLLQVVLGAILLETMWIWVLVIATSLCFAWLSIRHVPLAYPPRLAAVSDNLRMLGTWSGFALAGVLLVLFITRISRNLRARDAYLADVGQRHVEEEGIIRMGLFATGAAHELGTPLATLSVILADWRRMPQIADDPVLAEELTDMESEVRRCKVIVSDILQAAGEPRGEALESMAAATFLDDVTRAWRPADATLPFDYRKQALGDAVIAVDPALRQAIWNLLDNASEAATRRVELLAVRDGATLVIAVRDDGAGFAPAHLADVGKLYQSSKGAGHGVGLFLASNVARRLGGRLEAENMPGGGAEVRLVLPLLLTGEGA